MTLYRSDSPTASPRGHYVFVDGPSIDGTLGVVLGAAPGPETRPDWRRLETFVKQKLGPALYRATFILWSPGQQGFMHFLQSAGFTIALGERFTPGSGCVDLIREQITRLNQAAAGTDQWSVIVGTHNEDLIRDLPQIADQAERIAVFGFTEHLPDDPDIEAAIEIYDIEDDAKLFRVRLDRPSPDDDGDDPEDTQWPPEDDGYQRGEYGYRLPPSQPPAAAAPIEQRAGSRTMYLIVDGRSIEKELGEILGEKPNPDTRPDWGTVLEFARRQSRDGAGEVKALFAHIAPGHAGFRRALKDIGYTSSPVKPDESQPLRPVVEEFISGLLGAQAFRGDGNSEAPDIMVLSHSQAIFEALNEIPEAGQRLCALGFPERMPSAEFFPRIEQLDLERDAGAFAGELPREFGVDVDDFDPDEEISRLF